MVTKNKTPRAIATLKLPKNTSALVTFAVGVVKAMTGNANFPSPPSLTDLETAITALQTAETAAAARTKGAAAVRNQKKQVVVTLLEGERTYVQSVADTNPENGPGIVEGSGFALRKNPIHPPRGFTVKATGAGAVKIVVPAAAARASYEWQYSVDGGKTWVALPGTLKAKTTLTGLTPQSTVQVRYRALTKAGEGEWSQPVTQVVL